MRVFTEMENRLLEKFSVFADLAPKDVKNNLMKVAQCHAREYNGRHVTGKDAKGRIRI
jgi:hypothetical protein